MKSFGDQARWPRAGQADDVGTVERRAPSVANAFNSGFQTFARISPTGAFGPLPTSTTLSVAAAQLSLCCRSWAAQHFNRWEPPQYRETRM